MDDDTIKLLISVMSDEKKAARLAEIQDAMNELAAEMSKLNDAKAVNQDVLNESLKAKQAAVDMAADLGARSAELDAREEQMARVSEGIKNEQQRWETVVRQPTEVAHAQKAEDLTARETAVGFREKEIEGLKEKLLYTTEECKRERARYKSMAADLAEVIKKHSQAEE